MQEAERAQNLFGRESTARRDRLTRKNANSVLLAIAFFSWREDFLCLSFVSFALTSCSFLVRFPLRSPLFLAASAVKFLTLLFVCGYAAMYYYA